MTSQAALTHDKKSGREAIGPTRGGLTTKIHLTADLRCHPVARLTSPGQHGDPPYFAPLTDAIRVRRRGLGRPRRRTRRAMAGKAYSSRLTHFAGTEGVLFIGRAQEKVPLSRAAGH